MRGLRLAPLSSYECRGREAAFFNARCLDLAARGGGNWEPKETEEAKVASQECQG